MILVRISPSTLSPPSYKYYNVLGFAAVPSIEYLPIPLSCVRTCELIDQMTPISPLSPCHCADVLHPTCIFATRSPVRRS